MGVDSARVWLVRLVAPIAFLAAATALVILVQRALDDDSAPASGRGAATTVAVTTGATTSGARTSARRYYRIKAGDTLGTIAARFDTSVERLLAMNRGIDPLALTPGQRIRVG